GGTVGDESLVVPEQARFAAGEDVLFFAETRPRDQSLYTASLWQGKWTIERDSQSYARIATRAVPASDRGVFGQDIERREFSLFVAEIRSAAGKAPPVVKQANLSPDRVQASEATDVAAAPQFTFFDTPGRWNEFDARVPIPVDVE